jgi:hypothetical protein
MATIGVSSFRPIGRVFRITAVKAVHPLTIPSVPASSLSGSRIPASASGIQSSFREFTSPQSDLPQSGCLVPRSLLPSLSSYLAQSRKVCALSPFISTSEKILSLILKQSLTSCSDGPAENFEKSPRNYPLPLNGWTVFCPKVEARGLRNISHLT